MALGRGTLVFLLCLVLGCFSVEASIARKKFKTQKYDEDQNTLRGSQKKGTEADEQDSDDDDDDDDDDDEESKDAQKAADAIKVDLADNLRKQLEVKTEIKRLSDEAKSNKEIDASAGLVGKETESPAMANMLGKMWKEMRMFETPQYTEHLEEEIHLLKHEQHALEAKLEAKTKPAVAQAVVEATPSTSDDGNGDCACVGIDGLEGETVATLKDGSKVSYPADLGGRCEAWDLKKHPSCAGDTPAAWCKQEWCYVDPCKCKNVGVLPKQSVYLKGAEYKGKPVHYSYATCGGKDSYASEEAKKKTVKDIEKTCAIKADPAKWGAETCQCIGVSPQPGHTKVMIKDKLVKFPADTGAVCSAWEKDHHPDCDGDDAPDWCAQAWCYVDPCSCKMPVSPKTSSYLPTSTYQGKPVYFSYATCGGKDSWTAVNNKKACVNMKDSGACGKLDKCAWTGKECLGKELVNVCGLEEKSGSWSAKAIVALVLPMLALIQ